MSRKGLLCFYRKTSFKKMSEVKLGLDISNGYKKLIRTKIKFVP
jgi:hypothetical protein